MATREDPRPPAGIEAAGIKAAEIGTTAPQGWRARSAPLAVLLASGLAWGGTTVAGKVSTSTGHAPLGLVFWQLTISIVALGAISAVRGRRPPVSAAALRFYLVIALIGTLLPNAASLTATARLPAGIIAILLSSVPMFALAVASALGAERPDLRRIAGVALGLVGVALILGPEASLPRPEAWPFVLIGLLAPLFYGAEGAYVKLRMPTGLDPISALLGASVVGVALLTPVLIAVPGVWVAFPGEFGPAEQGMLVAGLLHAFAYTGYVTMVGMGGPVFASMVAYVVTVSGVLWGMALLGERHSPWVWAALAAMVIGMALVQPRR
ncbi:MAG: DMT family transporter [Pseudomonadota bacterium]